VEAVKTELGIREVEADVLEQIINAIAAEFAVKLDVRYDVVTNPDGVEVKIVTREAEVNGRDDDAVNWQLDMLCEALDESGYVTFVPDQLNYGELALSAQPGEHVDAVLEGKGVDVKTIRAEMEAQVDRVMEAYPEGNQIVVDLVDKAGVIARLTSAGDSDKAFREVITVVEEARSKIGRP